MSVPDFSIGLNSVFLAGLVLYSVFLVVTILSSLRHLWRNSNTTPKGTHLRISISGLFYLLVLLFLSCRITWTSVSLFEQSREYLLWGFNVGSDCLFFTCWTLIVLHWGETNWKNAAGESKMFTTVVGWVFLATNVVLYIFQAGVLVYVCTQSKSDDNNSALILTSILVAVLENVILGIGFLIFGLRLYCIVQRARSTIADEATLGQKASLRTTLVVTLVMTLSFLGRSALYIVQIVTHQDVNGLLGVDSVYRLVLIFVSELIPVAYQLWLQRSRKKQDEKHTRFIQDLYEQNDTASSDLADTDSLLDKSIN